VLTARRQRVGLRFAHRRATRSNRLQATNDRHTLAERLRSTFAGIPSAEDLAARAQAGSDELAKVRHCNAAVAA